jgi:hypothetical protein
VCDEFGEIWKKKYTVCYKKYLQNLCGENQKIRKYEGRHFQGSNFEYNNFLEFCPVDDDDDDDDDDDYDDGGSCGGGGSGGGGTGTVVPIYKNCFMMV